MRNIVVLGLVVYTILSGLGAFIESGLSSPFIIFWLVGYLLLTFSVTYTLYISPDRVNPFPLIVLGEQLNGTAENPSGGVECFNREFGTAFFRHRSIRLSAA